MLGHMMGAFAIDVHAEMKEAWHAINAAKADGASAEMICEMEGLFYAMPTHTMRDGSQLLFNAENYRAIREEWRNEEQVPEFRIEYTRFFRGNYRRIVEMSRGV